ncbi:hypothetical protein NE237_021848 [Protea cynaroides]|uniref:AAA+ ATPase domain-containing protein n=1 Tax=Protea cynaroides TaxID=273540 RepID=A0A9Q0K595_9MAGN|nr:hypothetical protein NE237_021848 [Protea cynaroides]
MEMKKVKSWESWDKFKEKMQEVKWDHWEQFINEMEKMELWKRIMVMDDNNLWETALQQVAGMRAIKIKNEVKLINYIVDQVSKIVHRPQFYIKYHVGLDFHIECIRHLLKDGLDDNGLEKIQFLGIYGSSGMGKTAIAQKFFNEMSQSFDDSCFLTMVKGASSQPNVLVIEGHLFHKKALIILDDVDDNNQLDNLVGERSRFGPGSLIIITTTNQDLVNTLAVDKQYEVKKMNPTDSLQLFSLYAFEQKLPPENYEALSNDVVKYTDGLPLALMVFGSLLSSIKGQRNKERELKRLKMEPTGGTLQKLEHSFTALDGREDQTIFLDISCFFIGEDKDEVIKILHACDKHAKARIRNLIKRRCLLTTNAHNKLCMHNMIREMAKAIVRKESPDEPGQRSRLWDKDAIEIWRNVSGSHLVRGFQLDLSMDEKLQWDTNVFFKMHNLKLLRIYGSERSLSHDDEMNLIFKKLVWIWWERFPFECLPNNFHMENLVILDMQMSSKLKQVWKGTTKRFPKLKVLNLSYSSSLTCLQNFSCALKLKKLIVKNCENLVKVGKSIGVLSRLVELDLSNCKKLTDLPSSITKLTSLNKFVIFGCLNLEKFPDEMHKLSKLETLRMSHCTSLKSLPMLPSSLCCLWAKYCESLEMLELNLSILKHLRVLDLSNCKMLKEIEGLEGLESVETINLFGCPNLTSFDNERIFQVLSKGIGNQKICDFFIPDRSEILRCTNPGRMKCSETCEVGKVPNMKIAGVIIRIVSTKSDVSFIDLTVVIDNQSKDSTWERKPSFSSHDDTDSIWLIKIPYCVWEEEIAQSGNIIKVSAISTKLCPPIQISVDFYTLQGTRKSYHSGVGSQKRKWSQGPGARGPPWGNTLRLLH